MAPASRRETQRVPIFPLGTVLLPGLVLPLHIFEPRYRELVHDLLAADEPREFGVVAIREGRETGVDGVSALYEVGCLAELRQVDSLPDGRFELLTVGTTRFRLLDLDRSRPYLQADVELLAEDGPGGDAGADEAAARRVAAVVGEAFRIYVDALATRESPGAAAVRLPDDPRVLSYAVAAAMVVDLPEKQSLLEAPTTVDRLSRERALLQRETGLLRALTSAPAVDLRRAPYSPN